MAPEARYPSDDVSSDPLGKPLHFEFSGQTAPNRFLKAAMTERISSWDPKNLEARGIPSDNLINVYKRWGEGDLGLILTGNIMIEYDQLEAAGNPIIPPTEKPEGKRFEAFKRLASASKAHGSLIVGQVSHPGRQVESKIQKDPVSASDVQLEGNIMGMTFEKPHPASSEEINHIIEAFAHAAEYLHHAGYHGIELHGAHGYLLSQFLSPTTNKRTDKYGGNLENRSRLIFEITEAIRKRVPSSFMVGIKINSVEFQNKGFDPEECKALCASLEAHRFDFVELSGGTYEELAFMHKRESTKKREAFFLDFAETIVPALTKTKTYITGGFKTVGAMVSALNTVDGVGLARPVCQEPRLCSAILKGEVKGAIKQRVDENNFGLTNVAAGSQIRMIGKDQEPIDLSQEANEKAFEKDMGHWAEAMSHDTGMYSFGYIDIESIKPNPTIMDEETLEVVAENRLVTGQLAHSATSPRNRGISRPAPVISKKEAAPKPSDEEPETCNSLFFHAMPDLPFHASSPYTHHPLSREAISHYDLNDSRPASPPPDTLISPAFTPPSTPGTATPLSEKEPKSIPVDTSSQRPPKLLEKLPKVECFVRARIPTTTGAEMFLHIYENDADGKEHLAIVFGQSIRSRSLDAVKPGETERDRMIRGAYTGRLYPGRTSSRIDPQLPNPEPADPPKPSAPLVRIHSECYTGETAWSARCDCGEQLDEAARLMSLPKSTGGAIVYLRQEGRGIGLGEKLKAYNLQDLGSDTVEANLLLRHPADARSYGMATAILMDLGLGGDAGIRLLTNNPDKVRAVEGPNREVTVKERVAMIPLAWKTGGKKGIKSAEVEGYLETKIRKMGHMIG